jgi:hypothetical protein
MTTEAVETGTQRRTQMIAKSLIAAAAIATTMAVALPASQAQAGVDINIGIGLGGFNGGYYEPGYYPSHKPHHNYISCGKGRNIVDWSGFNKVKAVDCTLPGYKYTAWRNGHKFVVRMNRWGNITDVNKIF